MTVPNQLSLSFWRILAYTTLITIWWLYLWFGGNRVMRTRRWQTWWQLGGYGALWALGLLGMRQERLLDIFSHIADVWTYPPVHSQSTLLYFELEVAWYLSSLVCLLINRELKDFWAMLFHHLITPAEVFYSYDCGYAAIGLVIMFLHDTSDVCLHLAKTFHNERLRRLTDATFILFALVFFITRLVLLPMCPYAYFTHGGDHHSQCGDALASMCSLLVGLHVYWFYLIVAMIVRFAQAGEVEGDVREAEVGEKREKRVEADESEQAAAGATAGDGTHAGAEQQQQPQVRRRAKRAVGSKIS